MASVVEGIRNLYVTRTGLIRIFAGALVSTLAFARSVGAPERDPAPALIPPASLEEIAIPLDGARINGLIYVAAGAGPALGRCQRFLKT